VEKGLENCPLCNEHLHPSHIAIEEDVSTKECMFCGETILEIANKCKHCGEWQKKKKQYVPCPICGELIEEGTEICPYCKEAIIIPIHKESVPCPICGEQIEVGIDKCPYCHESQRRCPLCGETIPLNSQVCPVCNSDLTEL
jgi:RNA polymerase subunit RPABC4/transcription elongation factor Spt4